MVKYISVKFSIILANPLKTRPIFKVSRHEIDLGYIGIVY